MKSEVGYWNGEPTAVKRCTLVVRDDSDRFPLFWGKDLAGQRIEAIEVVFYGDKFYLANHDGTGWEKVTKGRGSFTWPHKSVTPVEASVEYQEN